LRIVISGATSMLGSAVARLASQSGIEVLGLALNEPERLRLLPNEAEVKFCTLDEYPTLSPGRADAFFHLAWVGTTGTARDDTTLQLKNVAYTLDAVDLAHRMGCGCFVGVGSQAEYGTLQQPVTASTPKNPMTGYGMGKAVAGQMSRLKCGQLGMRHNWVRVFSAYGIGDNPNSLISYCIAQLAQGESPQLTPCEQLWDYLFCEDIARALLAVAQKGVEGKTYNIASGACRPLRDYVLDVRDAMGAAAVPDFGAKPYPQNQPMCLCADSSELRVDTGFCPEVDFRQGILKTLAFAANAG